MYEREMERWAERVRQRARGKERSRERERERGRERERRKAERARGRDKERFSDGERHVRGAGTRRVTPHRKVFNQPGGATVSTTVPQKALRGGIRWTFLESLGRFCREISPKVDKPNGNLLLKYPHKGPCVGRHRHRAQERGCLPLVPLGNAGWATIGWATRVYEP